MLKLLRKPFTYRYYNAVTGLIIANIAIFIIHNAGIRIFKSNFLYGYMQLNAHLFFGGAYWQIVTYMFTHNVASFMHILFNMLALYIFGRQLEEHIGSDEFLLFYFVSGMGAGFLSAVVYLFAFPPLTFLLGSSGAVFAVMLAFAVYFPESVIYIFGIIPVKAPVLIAGYAAFSLLSQIFGTLNGISHITHLGGFLVGFLYFIIRIGVNPMDTFKKHIRFR